MNLSETKASTDSISYHC